MSKPPSPQQFAFRLDDTTAAVVEAHRARLRGERPGEKVTISDAIRSLIMRGAEPADVRRVRRAG